MRGDFATKKNLAKTERFALGVRSWPTMKFTLLFLYFGDIKAGNCRCPQKFGTWVSFGVFFIAVYTRCVCCLL